MKTLIVDDVEINREMVAILLEGRAATVTAASGEEAITLAEDALREDDYFDLICMDIGLPGISGHQALKAIRELEAAHAKTPAKVFMITASSDPQDMMDALVEGDCDDYLTKPIMRQSFLALLEKHGLAS